MLECTLEVACQTSFIICFVTPAAAHSCQDFASAAKDSTKGKCGAAGTSR